MLTPRVQAWRDAGDFDEFRGHRIHVRRIEGHDPVLVMLHGFPSSSYDFSRLLPLTGDHAVLAFDFLGFGLSDKPRRHDYTLLEQADLASYLALSHFRGRSFFCASCAPECRCTRCPSWGTIPRSRTRGGWPWRCARRSIEPPDPRGRPRPPPQAGRQAFPKIITAFGSSGSTLTITFSPALKGADG